MRRISNESGEEASRRNLGRFFLFAIPAALGGAACLWIIAAFGWIDLTQTIRMQERAMESVGISAPPRTPIQVVNYDDKCLKLEKSYMDGDELLFYVRNACQSWLSLPNYSYRLKAPDGTVLESAVWAFSGDKRIGPGERREQRSWLKSDDRTVLVELRVID